jgi:protein O-mannosyl-transferase
MRFPNRKTLALLGAVLSIVTLAYVNHFGNSFHFDDSHTIIENPYIRDFRNIGLILTDARAFSTLPPNRVYRPVVTASLAADHAIAGGLRPFYFHASTFFWFSLQILLMYTLFRKLCDSAHPDPGNRWVALAAAGLFGLHPAVAETVNYIIQRGDVYSTLGVTAALALFAGYPGYRKWGLYLVPAVFGIFSKPPALIFPAILFAYVRLFEEERLPAALKKCVPALLATAGSGCLVLAMTPPTFEATIGSAYAYRITQPLVALRYFGSFFVPIRLNADSDFTAVNSVFERGAWLGFLFVLVLLAAAAWCSRRRPWRPAAFGLWWFLLALVPTSVFALSEVENDHRMYFPFAGLVLAVCWPVALGIFSRRPLRRWTVIAGAAACVIVFGLMFRATWQRNEVWRTEESLWLDVTIKSPRNGRGLMNYGLTQMEKGDFRKALDYFERAAVFNPAYSALEINRGIANGGLNQDAAAERHFLRAIELAPNSAESHYFYGRWLRQKNRPDAAIAAVERSIQANPDYMPARYLAMEIYAERGDSSRLRTASNSTLQRFPSDATAASFLSRANSLMGSGDAGSARLAGAARTADDYVNLSLAHYRKGNYEDCIQAAREALKRQPRYAVAFNNIAAAYAAMHNWDRAIEAAREALKIMPGFELAQNNLAWAESQKRLEKQGRKAPGGTSKRQP